VVNDNLISFTNLIDWLIVLNILPGNHNILPGDFNVLPGNLIIWPSYLNVQPGELPVIIYNFAYKFSSTECFHTCVT
jgi:hypothetical protein